MSDAQYEPAKDRNGFPVGPNIVCSNCFHSAWIQYENEPGMPTVIQCSNCRERSTINIVARWSAVRTMDGKDITETVGVEMTREMSMKKVRDLYNAYPKENM